MDTFQQTAIRFQRALCQVWTELTDTGFYCIHIDIL
jgi:hypothetical protein